MSSELISALDWMSEHDGFSSWIQGAATVVALWITLRQARGLSRATKRAAAAKIEAILVPVFGAIGGVRGMLGAIGPEKLSTLKVFPRIPEFENFLRKIDDVSLHEFPSRKSIVYAHAARIELATITLFFDDDENGPLITHAHLMRSIDKLEEIRDKLIYERDLVEHGWWSAFFNEVMRRTAQNMREHVS